MHTISEKAIQFRHPDRAQNLISLSLSRHLSTHNISSKSMHALWVFFFFFSYACHEPLFSPETPSSSAKCSRDNPLFIFVGTGFHNVEHRLGLATRTQVTVCNSPFPFAGTAVSLSLVSSSADQLKFPLQWYMRKTVVWRLLQKSSALHTNLTFDFLSCGALATWMRWAAAALVLTDGWVDLGGCWASSSRRISANSSGLSAWSSSSTSVFPNDAGELHLVTRWDVSYVSVTRLLVLLQ